jgi:tetratricopeptide (TPR) repeat protein
MGRFHWRKRTDEAVRASVDHFRKAIAQDSRYAPAYTGLADAICVLAERNLVRPSESLPEAKRAALAAVEINNNLADAYVSLGQVTSSLDFDLEASERHFRRALQLDETLAPAHHWYSYLLIKQRRFKEAQQHALRALELEPLSLPVNINVAVQHYYAGDDDRAVQQCRKLAQFEPQLIFNHLIIALVFARKGLAGEGKHEMSQIRPDVKEHPLTLRSWVEVYALSGEREKAQEYIDRLIAKQPAGGVPSSYIAAAYASVGDIDKAYAWLNRAYKERDSFMSLVDVYPSFASVRNDVRYEPLLRKLGLRPGTPADSARTR